jgi:hypothetical protein
MQRVFVRRIVSVTAPRAVASAFTFRKDRPLPRLQRLCLYVLKRIGAHYQYPEESHFVEHIVDGDTFMRRVFDRYAAAEDALKYTHTPTQLYLGPKEYQELLCEGSRSPFSPLYLKFDMKLREHYIEYPTRLTVTVLPYMEGILLV